MLSLFVYAKLQKNQCRSDKTFICIGNLIIIGSDNGLSPILCKAIIWTNAGILLIGP